MPCPICDQKAANCDCTETELRQNEEINEADARIAALEARVREVEGERDKAKLQAEKRWCPDYCPFTGLSFFMFIESMNGDGVMVPTYGGPFDSYTIPERDADGDYTRRRYDHDRGGWLVDEVEIIGVRLVEDWKVPDLEDRLKQAESDLAAARAEIAGLRREIDSHKVDVARLDSRTIRTTYRDEFGETRRVLCVDFDIRAAIDEAAALVARLVAE